MDIQEPYFPITIQQGATFVFPVQFLYGPTGEPLSLNGATAVFTIRSSYTATEVIAQCSTTVVGGSGIVINLLQGVMTITLTDTITAALTAPATGIYNLKVTSAIGVVARALQGPVLITPEVPE